MTVIGLVLSCEHASWTLPPGVDLGVPLDVLQSQAGWDHGAFDIASRLSEAVGLPVHAGAFTRMFVDLNRAADHADVIPAVSLRRARAGQRAPLRRRSRGAPRHVSSRPYWDAVRRDVAARLHDCGAVLHFSSHSFDPRSTRRPRVRRRRALRSRRIAFEAELAERLMFPLRAAGLEVRANQPYSGIGPAICTSLRNELAGKRYAGIELETSHAVTHSTGGCARVAAAVVPFLESLQLPS